MNHAKDVAFIHRVADFFLDDETDAGVNRVLFFLAAATKQHARDSHLLALNTDEVAGVGSMHASLVARVRKPRGIIHHAGVTSL